MFRSRGAAGTSKKIHDGRDAILYYIYTIRSSTAIVFFFSFPILSPFFLVLFSPVSFYFGLDFRSVMPSIYIHIYESRDYEYMYVPKLVSFFSS